MSLWHSKPATHHIYNELNYKSENAGLLEPPGFMYFFYEYQIRCRKNTEQILGAQ